MKKIVYWKGFKVFIGLMFKNPDKDSIYILDIGRDSDPDIHTFFCLKPLDMYLINSKGEIVKYYKKVKPFRFIFFKEKKFRFLVEGLDINEEDIKDVINYLYSRKIIE